MKTCTKCGETKPLMTGFSKDSKSRDGRTVWCKACMNTARSAHRRANPEKTAAYNAQWRRDNPDYDTAWQRANRDKVNAKAAKYRQANPDRIAAAGAKWRENNPTYHAEYHEANPHVAWETSYRIRCDKFGVTPVVERFTREDVAARYGDGCFYCDGGAFEVIDHSHTVGAGGEHTLDNVRPACATCNELKRQTKDMLLIKVYRTIRDAIADYLAAA